MKVQKTGTAASKVHDNRKLAEWVFYCFVFLKESLWFLERNRESADGIIDAKGKGGCMGTARHRRVVYDRD